MMPLHSFLLIRQETLCSSQANLHRAAWTDRKPAYGDALVALLPVSDEAKYPVDGFVVTQAIGEKLRYSNNVDDVAHISLAGRQWKHLNTSDCDSANQFVAVHNFRDAASVTAHIQILDGALA